MTDLSFFFLYIFISIGLYIPSLWCKLKRSDKHYSKLVSRVIFTHNVAVGTTHHQVIESQYLYFYGYVDNPILWLVSLLCFVLHMTTYPVSEDERFWRKRWRLKFWKKGFDPRIR